MEVGEQRVVGAQAGPFGGQGLLDLDDHLGVGEDVIRRADHDGTDLLVVDIAEAGSVAGPGLHGDLVAAVDELASGAGSETDAVFVSLGFRRDTDVHGSAPVGVGRDVTSRW